MSCPVLLYILISQQKPGFLKICLVMKAFLRQGSPWRLSFGTRKIEFSSVGAVNNVLYTLQNRGRSPSKVSHSQHSRPVASSGEEVIAGPIRWSMSGLVRNGSGLSPKFLNDGSQASGLTPCSQRATRMASVWRSRPAPRRLDIMCTMSSDSRALCIATPSIAPVPLHSFSNWHLEP